MSRYITSLVAAGAALAAAACTSGTLVDETAATFGTGAPPAATAYTEEVEATVAQLEREWVAAIVKKDAAALDRLLAEEFAGVSPTAHYYDKSMAIDDLTTGTYQVESMVLDEVSVNAYGDFAVAFASQEEKSRYAGTDISGHYHYTNVWARRDGRWQVVASHGTRYDTPHDPLE
jgi:ketosteroid isomerase-like protein